jgi:hypothetical protein
MTKDKMTLCLYLYLHLRLACLRLAPEAMAS